MKKTTKNNSERGQKVGQILGINVNSSLTISLLARVEDLISDSYKLGNRNIRFYIVTPNPELILMAQTDKKLKNALNSADLSVPDGIGVAMASKFLSLPVPKNKTLKFFVVFFQGLKVGFSVFFDKKWLISNIGNIKGRELFMDLIKLANNNKWRVFLLGGLNEEAKLCEQKLKDRYRDLKIISDSGRMKLDSQGQLLSKEDEVVEKQVIDKINKFAPQLLFVAFGNPKQEIWIHEHLGRLNIGGAMAVGGTFRYIAGLSKLPPKWMASLGLEWLWRLITEPVRIGRIFRAIVVFPLCIFTNRIVSFTREQRD